MPADYDTNAPPSLRVCVLASGSSGNATLVSDGATTVLIDAGISAREIYRRAAVCGFDADTVSAVLVTHEHTDHTRGIRVFAKRCGATVIASAGTLRAAELTRQAEQCARIRTDEELAIGTLRVRAFPTSHDAAEPLGLRIDGGHDALGYATDTGELSEAAHDALAGCSTLALEANHDLEMLERGPYPRFLKVRVASARGHLSNVQSADAIERLAHDGLRRVFAMHVSRTNNTFDLAGRALAERLRGIGLQGVVVRTARHDVPTDPSLEIPGLEGR